MSSDCTTCGVSGRDCDCSAEEKLVASYDTGETITDEELDRVMEMLAREGEAEEEAKQMKAMDEDRAAAKMYCLGLWFEMRLADEAEDALTTGGQRGSCERTASIWADDDPFAIQAEDPLA